MNKKNKIYLILIAIGIAIIYLQTDLFNFNIAAADNMSSIGITGYSAMFPEETDSLRGGRSRDGTGTDINTINGQNSNGTNGTDVNSRWDNQVIHRDTLYRLDSVRIQDTIHIIDSTGRLHNENIRYENYADKIMSKNTDNFNSILQILINNKFILCQNMTEINFLRFDF